MHQVPHPKDFAAWRLVARSLLNAAVPPSEIIWAEPEGESGLFAESTLPVAPQAPLIKVPGEFLALAERVAAHRDPRRWAVLYSLLYRMTHGGVRHLLQIGTDPEVHQSNQWIKAINRDVHKMHAFVRFRLTGINESTGRENFVAWFEPMHRIVRLAAPFFKKRFTGMDWAILTPDECVRWDGTDLHFTPGLERDAAPTEDELDDLWRTYYRSIFNPARIKESAMLAEMPKKYWKNLPEAEIIESLLQEGSARVSEMLSTPERPERPAPANAYLESLKRKNEGEG